MTELGSEDECERVKARAQGTEDAQFLRPERKSGALQKAGKGVLRGLELGEGTAGKAVSCLEQWKTV